MNYQFDLQDEENRLWLNLKRLFNLDDAMRAVYFENHETALSCITAMSRRQQSFMINDKLDKLTVQDVKNIKTKSDYFISNIKYSKWSNITINNELIQNKDRSYMFELKDVMIAILLCEIKFINKFILYINDLTVKGETDYGFSHNIINIINDNEELVKEFNVDFLHNTSFSMIRDNTVVNYCAITIYENCNFINTFVPFMRNELSIMLNCNIIDTYKDSCVKVEHSGKIFDSRMFSLFGYKPFITLCLYNCTVNSNLLYDAVSKVIILTENKLDEEELTELRASISVPNCLPMFNVLLVKGIPDETPAFAFNNKEDNWCSLDCDVCDCD